MIASWGADPALARVRGIGNDEMSYRIPKIRTVVVLFLFLLASGCSDRSEIGVHSQTVIRVDDHVLTLTEFNEFFEPLEMSCANGKTDDGSSLREARLRFLLELLEEMIILRRAEELDLHISSQELEEAVGNIQGDYSEDGFEAMFLKQAISFETWQERLKKQMLVEKVIDKDLLEQISVKPAEIRSYYDKHNEEWTHGNQVRALHILLPKKEEADLVLKRLKKGEDFATLARQYSTAPESEKGGDMGYMARGHLPQFLEDPLFFLKKDKLSRVIKTPYGYHIFKVVETRKAGKSKMDDWVEEIRERVRKEKLEIAYGPWLAKLRSRYRIMVNEEAVQ